MRCWQLLQLKANNKQLHASVVRRPFECKLMLILTSRGGIIHHFKIVRTALTRGDVASSVGHISYYGGNLESLVSNSGYQTDHLCREFRRLLSRSFAGLDLKSTRGPD